MNRLSFWLVATVISASALANIGASKPSDCSIKVLPRLALAPVREVRVTVTIEQKPDVWREAVVYLSDELGEITRTTIFEGDASRYAKRTTERWLKSLSLGPGEYVVQLSVQGIGGAGCVALERIEVHDSH